MTLARIRLQFWLIINDWAAWHTFHARLALIHAEDAAQAKATR
jgi:hypothetical protein